MLLELHIRRTSRKTRKPGSEISIGETIYHFKPRPKVTDGDEEAHVCEVRDPGHLKRLLSIHEYTIYGEKLPDLHPPAPVEELGSGSETELDMLAGDEEIDLELNEEPQDPLEVEMCKTISEMTVPEATMHLPGLSDEQLHILAKIEREGENRITLLKTINEELKDRTDQD